VKYVKIEVWVPEGLAKFLEDAGHLINVKKISYGSHYPHREDGFWRQPAFRKHGREGKISGGQVGRNPKRRNTTLSLAGSNPAEP